MAYTKTTWNNNRAPYINADNLNKIENALETHETKLDTIETGATADQTAAEIMAAVQTLDGSGSSLDSDLLDGQEGAFYQNADNLNAGTLPAARFDDTAHGSRSGGALHSAATTGTAGFLSAADKTKLDATDPTAISAHISASTEVHGLAAGSSVVGTADSQTLINKVLGTGSAVTLGSDAEGDIYYRNGSGVLARLGAGSNGGLLTQASGIPAWLAPGSNGYFLSMVGGMPTYVPSPAVPVGVMATWPAATPPAGWLERNGAALSMTSYELLYDVLGSMYGLGTGTTITFTNATNTVNAVAHGLTDGTVLELSNSGGALPAGLTASTKYFVVNAAANTYQVSLTTGGAAVAFSDDGTGTSYHHTQFKLMDSRGLFPRYWDHGAGVDPDAASRTDRGDGTTGDNIGTKQDYQIQSHTHRQGMDVNTANYGSVSIQGSQYPQDGWYSDIEATGGNETRPKNIYEMPIIKAY